MRDDYLWDGSGEPDPEVERLEFVLGKLRLHRPAPEWPRRVAQFPLPWLGAGIPLPAAVAAMLLLAAGVWVSTRGPRPIPESVPPGSAWDITSLEGRPMGRLRVGESLETDAASRAKMNVGAIGEMEIEPNTLVRLLAARPKENRVALDRGSIAVQIWAPPRLFFVNTPSAVAVDLGCAYTLEVDAAGGSLLRTTMGWVGFEWNGRESFVPAGAACATQPGLGPGTPYFEDSSEAFRAVLARFDFSGETGRAAALSAVLTQARPRDALTLWHILSRVPDAERGRVYDRLAELVPAPAGVTRQGVQGLNRHMLDLWWDALGLGEASWWRRWKGPYPGK